MSLHFFSKKIRTLIKLRKLFLELLTVIGSEIKDRFFQIVMILENV